MSKASSRKFLQLLALSLVGCVGPAVAAATTTSTTTAAAKVAEAYPDRPITFIMPFGPGSDTDYFGRNLSEHVKKYLGGATIVVENRAGESGTLAAKEVHGAAPDGYTLLIGRIATQAIAPALDHKIPYRWNEFTMLGLLELEPMICAVRADSPYKTARDLLLTIRKSPGKLKYGTSGPGTLLNLAPQYMLRLSGLKSTAVVGVHFDSGQVVSEALRDGRVDFVCNNAGTLIPGIKSGALRGLFTTAPGRLNDLPQLQNASEAGMRDMGNLLGWSVLVGPRNLPAPVVERWKTALKQLAHDPAWIAGTAARGGIPALGMAKDSEKFVKSQFELFDNLISVLDLRQ